MHSTLNLQNEFKASVCDRERWYGGDPPLLLETFNAWATNFRRRQTIEILQRDARQLFRRGDDLLGRQFEALAEKFSNCKEQRRCGSQGCLKCLRAYQKAKAGASKLCLTEIAKQKGSGKKLVMATCVPIWMQCEPVQLSKLNLADCNKWHLRRLKGEGFSRPMLGSIDISWEKGFYQPHWHFATWTSNRIRLKERLKQIFPGDERYDRPVQV